LTPTDDTNELARNDAPVKSPVALKTKMGEEIDTEVAVLKSPAVVSPTGIYVPANPRLPVIVFACTEAPRPSDTAAQARYLTRSLCIILIFVFSCLCPCRQRLSGPRAGNMPERVIKS